MRFACGAQFPSRNYVRVARSRTGALGSNSAFMALADYSGLSDATREFAERLLDRFPAWEAFIAPYRRVNDKDTTPPGSVWLAVPSPADPSTTLWAIVQDREALVGLGDRAAERLFFWDAEEREDAFRSVISF